MRRWFRRAIIALLLLVVAPLGGVLAVLGTETGTRWLLIEALSRTADEWRLQAVRGDLLSTLELDQLYWRSGESSLALDSTRLAWQPSALFTGLLHVEELRVVGVRVTAPAGEPEPEPAGPPSVPELPLAVRIDRLHVEDVRTDIGGNEFQLYGADLATRIEGRTLHIETLTASAPEWNVAAAGEVRIDSPFPFALRLDWRAEVPGMGGFEGGGDFDGDSQRVAFVHRLQTPFSVETRGTVDIDGLASRGRIEASWEDLALPLGEDELRSRHGELVFEGGADDLTLELDADVAGPGFALDAASLSVTGSVQPQAPHALNLAFAWEADLGAEPAAVAEAVLAGGGSIAGDLERLRVDHSLSVPFRLTTSAEVGLAEDPLTLAVQGEWRELRWPLTGDAEYHSATGEYRASGDLAHLEYRLGADFAALAADIRAGRVDLQGGADLAPPFAFDTALDWRLRLPDTVATDVMASGGGRVSGDMDAIDLDHALREPFTLVTRGRVQPASEEQLLDIEGEWQGLRWPLTGEPEVTSESGRYSARGGLAELLTQVDLGLAGPAVPLAQASVNAHATLALTDGFGFDARLGWGGVLPDEVAVAAEGSASGNLSRIEFEHRITAPFAVETSGSVALDGAAPRLDVRGGWREARWPLAGEEAEFTSSQGDLTLTGTPEDYRLGLEAELDGRDLPPVTAHIDATGSTTAARIRSLRLDTLDGNATLAGSLQWAPDLAFDLTLTGRELDPGQQWSDWGGRLGFDIAASGELAEQGPVVSVSRLELDGDLRGYPLSARGSAEVAGSRVRIPSLTLRSGDNRLALEGVVDETLAVDFDLEATDLAAFWPGLGGALSASGEVLGSLQAPRVQASMNGERLRFEEYTVARLDLEADVDVAGGDSSRVQLDLADAVLAGQTVNSLALSASGGPAAHRATLSADAELADLGLELEGALAEDGWRGSLQRLEIDPAYTDPWRLAAPAGIRTSNDGSARLERLCLGQQQSSLCARFTQGSGGKLDGSLAIERLPLAVIGPWLPPEVGIEGTLEASATVAGTAAAPRVSFEVAPPPGALQWQPEGREPLRVAWNGFRVEGEFRDDALASRADIEMGELGRIAAEVNVGAASKDGERGLGGRVDVGINDLAIAAAFAPQIANPEGRIRVAATLGGTLSAPGVDGTAEFDDGAVQLPDLGLSISEINLQARNRGQEAMVFEGSMRSGGGTLSLDGELLLDAARGFPLQLDITGERFEVARLPEAQVFASPDLSLRRDAELTRLSGSVTVPEATLRVREMPAGAVSVSDDEVMAQEEYREPETAMAVGMDLQLVLGDRVTFNGFGLDTRLTGRMRVTAEAGEPLLGEGSIDLVDGYYQAYGQDLSIERGRLLFAGPLDNPGLDVRAVRDTGEVKAGLQVSGTASNLSARVYSEPPLPDAEALSYLLTGRGLDSASSGEGSMLSSAALALGLDNADTLSRKIGRQFGLDDVGITGAGADAGLRLGKYLAPDLYLSYVLGLFGGQGAVQLDYQLTDRISVQGRSGSERQAVDLLYRFESD